MPSHLLWSLPVHSAASWGYCSKRGAPQDPEWRTARWGEEAEEATGRTAASAAGTHSCGRNASFGLPWPCDCPPVAASSGCSRGSRWPRRPAAAAAAAEQTVTSQSCGEK